MIEEWPSWIWKTTLASLTDPFMRFCPAIWRWDLLVRSLFRVVSASRWRTEPHIVCCAAISRREKHSCHHPTTVLSGSRSEWLPAVPCSENVPQGDAFHIMEDIESNATAELRKIPKEASRQCIQQWQDLWSKCVCAQGSDFEGDWISVLICPTIKVLYHNSGNFVTASLKHSLWRTCRNVRKSLNKRTINEKKISHRRRGCSSVVSVVCRCVWSRNLRNEEVLAYWGAVVPNKWTNNVGHYQTSALDNTNEEWKILWILTLLTRNDLYMSRTAPLTSKHCILYIYSTNIGTEYFKHALYFPLFLFKMQFVS